MKIAIFEKIRQFTRRNAERLEVKSLYEVCQKNDMKGLLNLHRRIEYRHTHNEVHLMDETLWTIISHFFSNYRYNDCFQLPPREIAAFLKVLSKCEPAFIELFLKEYNVEKFPQFLVYSAICAVEYNLYENTKLFLKYALQTQWDWKDCVYKFEDKKYNEFRDAKASSGLSYAYRMCLKTAIENHCFELASKLLEKDLKIYVASGKDYPCDFTLKVYAYRKPNKVKRSRFFFCNPELYTYTTRFAVQWVYEKTDDTPEYFLTEFARDHLRKNEEKKKEEELTRNPETDDPLNGFSNRESNTVEAVITCHVMKEEQSSSENDGNSDAATAGTDAEKDV